MIVRQLLSAAVVAGGFAIAFPSTALADDNSVTYEVTSNDIDSVNIKYWDGNEDQTADGSTLPWKTDAPVGDLAIGAKDAHHAELHATWRNSAAPGKIVTVKITYKDKVICQNSSDEGQADCRFDNFVEQQQQVNANPNQ